MPLPLFLGIGAAVAGATGLGAGIHGAKKMKNANDTMKDAKKQHEKNLEKFEQTNLETATAMDTLGKTELEILKGFETFSDTIEKIQNRPEFKQYRKDGVNLPVYDKEELKKVSVGAGVLLGGLGGAALGTAGGFAAAGATTAAVMALGTASTGTAIASLSGAAAVNATLAALGGGAIAAGGGGIALGTTMLGVATAGVGLLVGGIIFNFAGSKLSDKADEAHVQMETAQREINQICTYLTYLRLTSGKFIVALNKVKEKYDEVFGFISYVVNVLGKTDWNDFSEAEKLATENCVLLVDLLYEMCKVNLVNKAEDKTGINAVNYKEVKTVIQNSEQVLSEVFPDGAAAASMA